MIVKYSSAPGIQNKIYLPVVVVTALPGSGISLRLEKYSENLQFLHLILSFVNNLLGRGCNRWSIEALYQDGRQRSSKQQRCNKSRLELSWLVFYALKYLVDNLLFRKSSCNWKLWWICQNLVNSWKIGENARTTQGFDICFEMV